MSVLLCKNIENHFVCKYKYYRIAFVSAELSPEA